MNKLFTVRNFITLFTGLAIIFVLLKLDACRNRKFEDQRNTIDSLTLANQKMVQDTNRLGEIISKQGVIITSDQRSLQTLTEGLFNLMRNDEKRIRQIDNLIQIKSNTGVKEVQVPYVDLEKQKRFSDSMERVCADVIKYYRENTIEVPRRARIDSPYFKFGATVNKKDMRIDSIQFPDIQRIAVVETKGGLFRKDINGKTKIFSRKQMEVNVVHKNPHIEVQGMSSITYKPKVTGRWVERGVMVGVGVLITKLLLKR